jgi:hypothetical protein
MTEPKGAKAHYKTTNWAEWYAPPSGKGGRQQIFSDPTIQFCLSIKCLFGLALRQSLGTVESLLRLAGLDWKVPDFSAVSRRQKSLRVQLPYRPSTAALDLLVDSTGIKFLGEGEWKRKKHGAEYRRQWRKVHLGIYASTLEIRAIEVTDNSVGDAPMLPELLGQIPPNEAIASVSADGAYDTKACHAAIVERGAQAVIPPRTNAQAAGGGDAGPDEHDTSAHERAGVESNPAQRARAQRGAQGLPKTGQAHLEEVERLPTAAAWWRPRCIASNAWVSG